MLTRMRLAVDGQGPGQTDTLGAVRS